MAGVVPLKTASAAAKLGLSAVDHHEVGQRPHALVVQAALQHLAHHGHIVLGRRLPYVEDPVIRPSSP